MNFLFHLYLSGDDPELLVGNFMGDFVKGRLGGNFPPGIERGIWLHRRIDTFAGGNRHFLLSKKRLDPSFGHYRGVLVDLFYDHFLALNWDRYCDSPYRSFLADAALIVQSRAALLPGNLRRLVPIFFGDLLPSYLEVEGIGRALERMSSRIARRNPLGNGAGELLLHYEGLSDDFREFLPEAREFVREESSKQQPAQSQITADTSG